MCKIFCGVGFENKQLLWEMIGTAAPLISKYNSHGFGIACYSEQTKKMWTEKFLVPEDAWDEKKFTDRRDTKGFRKTGKRTPYDTTPTVFSHARMATNAKTIENTHPFVRGNSALIHNGTVSRTGLKFLQGTCDSEGILNAYFDLNVSHNPNNFPYLIGLLYGSFACAVLTKVNDKYCVDIFKNAATSLSKITIEGERGFLISTVQLDAERVIKYVGRRVQKLESIDSDILTRYCATTGEKLLERKYNKPLYSKESKSYISEPHEDELNSDSSDDEMISNFTSGREPAKCNFWDNFNSETSSSSSATHIKKKPLSTTSASTREGSECKRTYVEEQLEIGSIHDLINKDARPERIKEAGNMLP